MQRNRKIRKVVQPPIVVEHTTNIHRRQDSRNFVKSVNTQQYKENLKVRLFILSEVVLL